MRQNGHEDSCLCDWCGAILASQRREKLGIPYRPEAPPPLRELRYARVEEPPPSRSPVKQRVTPLAKRLGVDKHQAKKRLERALSSPPPWDEVVAVADQFPVVEGRGRPSSSGCWYCLDEAPTGPLCAICVDMVTDYIAFKYPLSGTVS